MPIPNPTPALKILMLHGYTQSGPLFHSKTRALEKSLQKLFPGTTLHYPTAPFVLHASDIPGNILNATASDDAEAYGWWKRRDNPTRYEGLEKGLARIAETILQDGPFDGVVGFSQGAAAAAMVISLLEPGRREAWPSTLLPGSTEGFAFPGSFVRGAEVIQAPLAFGIVYSGFMAPGEGYAGFYHPRLKTPTLHVLGSLDTLVEEGRGRALVACFETERVLVHPGGHFVPSQRPWLEVVGGFVRDVMGGVREGRREEKEDERVEDMDVPF